MNTLYEEKLETKIVNIREEWETEHEVIENEKQSHKKQKIIVESKKEKKENDEEKREKEENNDNDEVVISDLKEQWIVFMRENMILRDTSKQIMQQFQHLQRLRDRSQNTISNI